MGDSQNWSSFEEPATPKKPKAAAKPQPTPADVGVGSAAGSTGAGDLLSAANVRLVQQRLMFGAIVGFCTGATFGSIDAVKAYHKQHGRVALAGLSQFTRAAAISGASFSGFFFAYQGVRTLLEAQRKTDDLVNVGVATVAAAVPFVRSPVMRQNVPYALMLIALDHFHEEINDIRK